MSLLDTVEPYDYVMVDAEGHYEPVYSRKSIEPMMLAIEAAAIMKCVEVCESVYPEGVPLHLVAKGFGEKLRALIPQDGRTQLGEFGMKVGTEMLNQCGDIAIGINELHAIVTNLIGEKS